MEVKIVRATQSDVSELTRMMEEVAESMENPAWFMRDDGTYIKEHIGSNPVSEADKGFVLKAMVREPYGEWKPAGFFMADFPGITEQNLGNHINLSPEKLAVVAHMDSVVVLSQYRGRGLQYKLIREAEKLIESETEYRILMATVHPDNRYSLRNVMAHGYEVVAETLKYGGYPRFILKKEI